MNARKIRKEFESETAKRKQMNSISNRAKFNTRSEIMGYSRQKFEQGERKVF